MKRTKQDTEDTLDAILKYLDEQHEISPEYCKIAEDRLKQQVLNF